MAYKVHLAILESFFSCDSDGSSLIAEPKDDLTEITEGSETILSGKVREIATEIVDEKEKEYVAERPCL